VDAGQMHWRCDRRGGTDPGGDPLDAVAAFSKFSAGFTDLLGAASPPDANEMEAFTAFALSIRYPPNPIRHFDDTLTATQASGRDLFLAGGPGIQPCVFCHVGPIATDGFSSFDGEPQPFKVPHLRNQYQKVGMFGMP